MESITEIIARMRKPSLYRGKVDISRVDADFRYFADKLEAAIAQTPQHCGNTAKMREALEWFWSKRSMLDFCHNNLSAKTWEDWDKVYCFLREFAGKVQNALSEPSRNCDVCTEEEQYNRFVYSCTSRKIPCRKSEIFSCTKCYAEWAQMPYEGEEVSYDKN